MVMVCKLDAFPQGFYIPRDFYAAETKELDRGSAAREEAMDRRRAKDRLRKRRVRQAKRMMEHELQEA